MEKNQMFNENSIDYCFENKEENPLLIKFTYYSKFLPKKIETKKTVYTYKELDFCRLINYWNKRDNDWKFYY